MKSVKTLSPLIVLLLLAACRSKQSDTAPQTIQVSGGKVYSDSAQSSVKVFDQNGKVCIQQSNTYYELTDVYEGAAKIPLLLKINKTELCFADSVNKQKVFEIEAKSILDTKSVAWQAKIVATQLQFNNNTMLAIYEGADGEEDYLRRYSLLTGTEIFSASYSELKVAIPNVKDKRFIGFTSRAAATQPLREMNTENLAGIIRYSSDTAGLSTVKLLLKRSAVATKIPAYTPDMVLVPTNENSTAMEDGKLLVLMKADENYTATDVKDFSVKLSFYIGDDNEATNILIPVVNDRLNADAAQFDKQLFEIKP